MRIARGAALNCRPLSVIVVEPGCKVKAFKKEDGASMIRFEMAYGKAYAALSLGRSSKLVRERAQERPIFMRYLIAVSGDQIFPEGGGMLIRDSEGEVIGAVGVTGDTEDRDEELAVHGIHAARIASAWDGGSGCRRNCADGFPHAMHCRCRSVANPAYMEWIGSGMHYAIRIV